MILEFPFETPSKKNSRVINTRTGRSFPNKRYSDWHKNAKMYVLTHYKVAPILSKSVKISFLFCHGDNVKRDSDNQVSSILDLLQDLNILPDDCWQIVRAFSVVNTFNKNLPLCRVTIEPFEE